MRGIKYGEFAPEYKSSVSEALFRAINDITKKIGRKPRYQDFLALYFSGATGAQAVKGIKFQFIQQQEMSKVAINGKLFPVFDIYEGQLYKHLFQEYMVDEYTLIYKNLQSTVDSIAPVKKFVEPYIKFNLNLHSLRQLRTYALVKDYNLKRETVKEVLGYRTWIFGVADRKRILDEFAIMKVGIKLSPNVV